MDYNDQQHYADAYEKQNSCAIKFINKDSTFSFTQDIHNFITHGKIFYKSTTYLL